ncbi:hypothetical protein HYV81_01440 [Candidatus Woesearchaeota archaeon]|nr:hypothetical protein [Candidatus Woesearchaeota archaeon]
MASTLITAKPTPALTVKPRMTKDEYFKPKGQYEEEIMEEGKDQMVKTGYPKPTKRYRLVYETFSASLEETYFWVLNYLRYDLGCQVEKITDVFVGTEHSTFFGVSQQRIGLQQDKVSQFLATIGKMVRELFQLVRELRILDERLHYYADSYDEKSRSRESAEITLKGVFIDQAEGGAKNPASVFGMARELQFTTLPDLFFSVHPLRTDDVDRVVEKLDFNRKVKEVLKRKLRSYLEWKEHTYKELKSRRLFTLRYLRQHFDIIKMYMMWVKPYLRNIKRMHSEVLESQKETSPDLITAFEGAVIEVELLCKRLPRTNKKYMGVAIYNFRFRVRPELKYQAEGYQRGPIHIGEIKVTARGYGWSKDDIENYKRYRAEEDFELLALVDRSVEDAMVALGDELMKYLEEAGEMVERKEPEQKKPATIYDPFTSMFKGFGELFGLGSKKGKPHEKGMSKLAVVYEKRDAERDARGFMWPTYKNYKKAHGMLSW